MPTLPLNDASPLTYNLLFNDTSELTNKLPFNDKSFVTFTLKLLIVVFLTFVFNVVVTDKTPEMSTRPLNDASPDVNLAAVTMPVNIGDAKFAFKFREESTYVISALAVTAVVTNCVVASCVVFVPAVAVRAKILPQMSTRPLNDASRVINNLPGTLIISIDVPSTI